MALVLYSDIGHARHDTAHMACAAHAVGTHSFRSRWYSVFNIRSQRSACARVRSQMHIQLTAREWRGANSGTSSGAGAMPDMLC